MVCTQNGGVGTGSNAPTTSTGTGAGGGSSSPPTIITSPTAPEFKDKTSCQSLKDLYDPTKANIAGTIRTVNTNANGLNGEAGAAFNFSNGAYTNPILPSSTNLNGVSYNLTIPADPNTYGAVHTHPVNGNPPAAPMFSFGDLYWLCLKYLNTDPSNKSDVVLMLKIPDGNLYAIKIDDISKVRQYLSSYDRLPSVVSTDNLKKKVDEKIKQFDKNTSNGAAVDSPDAESKYVRGFLDEMAGKGVTLFRNTDNMGTSWERLDPPVNPSSSQIQSSKCN